MERTDELRLLYADLQIFCQKMYEEYNKDYWKMVGGADKKYNDAKTEAQLIIDKAIDEAAELVKPYGEEFRKVRDEAETVREYLIVKFERKTNKVLKAINTAIKESGKNN